MTLALTLDYFSYFIFAITVAIVVYKGIELWAPKFKENSSAELNLLSESSFSSKMLTLEVGLTALSVIASAAPFIGLMGTVLHIMDALSKVSTSLDVSVISGPIATALNSTLVGLASAVPAASAHGFIARKLYLLRSRYALSHKEQS